MWVSGADVASLVNRWRWSKEKKPKIFIELKFILDSCQGLVVRMIIKEPIKCYMFRFYDRYFYVCKMKATIKGAIVADIVCLHFQSPKILNLRFLL